MFRIGCSMPLRLCTLSSIFEDRIEFVSIGGLIKGLTIKDILFGVSQCRNEKLAAKKLVEKKMLKVVGNGMKTRYLAFRNDE